MGIEFPAAIFGVLALVAGILMYWIPETLRSPMHQTIEEAVAAEDNYGIPCCGKPLKRRRDVEMPELERQQDATEGLLRESADIENEKETEIAEKKAENKEHEA